MAKWANDLMMDAGLDYVGGATTISVCSAQPANRTAAHTTNMLATAAISGSMTKADAASGRKITIPAQSALSISNAGTATHIALYDATNLRYVTTCPSQALTTGGTVNIGAFEISIGDPT